MRAVEFVAGLLVFAVLFIVLKLLGMVIKFALIVALVGFVIGFFATRAFRSGS